MKTYQLTMIVDIESNKNHNQIINWLLDRWVATGTPEEVEYISWDEVDWFEVKK